MLIPRRIIVLVSSLLYAQTVGLAQCSDAGVCSLETSAAPSHQKPQHRLAFRYLFGQSGKPDDVTFHTARLEADIAVYADARISLSLPYVRISGPAGKGSGMGDITLVWTQSVYTVGEHTFSAQIGTRLATGEANANPTFAHAYQPGLGSHDILLGISWRSGEWGAGVAYQVAGKRSTHALTRLQRGNDGLVWGAYSRPVGSLVAEAQLLVINRFQEDTILEPGSSPEKFIPVANSAQLQVNVGGTIGYPIGQDLTVQAGFALPLLKRDVNIDGLKRALTLSVGVVAAL